MWTVHWAEARCNNAASCFCCLLFFCRISPHLTSAASKGKHITSPDDGYLAHGNHSVHFHARMHGRCSRGIPIQPPKREKKRMYFTHCSRLGSAMRQKKHIRAQRRCRLKSGFITRAAASHNSNTHWSCGFFLSMQQYKDDFSLEHQCNVTFSVSSSAGPVRNSRTYTTDETNWEWQLSIHACVLMGFEPHGIRPA